MDQLVDLHGAQNLSQRVYRKLSPWKFSIYAIRKCHGGVDVSPRDARRVPTKRVSTARKLHRLQSETLVHAHSQHDAETPAPADGLVIPLGAVAEHDLSDDAITKHDEDKGAQEL